MNNDKSELFLRRLYVLYDRLTEESGPIMEQPTDAAAIRAVKNMFKETKRDHQDYELILVGERTIYGVIKSITPIKIIFDMEEDINKNLKVVKNG